MSKISAKIVADSINEFNNRITTLEVVMPRIILAEFNTHRMFSRNSASSRAIPFSKMVEAVETNPFIPIAFQKEHKGMQGTEYITGNKEIQYCIDTWLRGRDHAIRVAKTLNQKAAFPKGDFDSSYDDTSVTKQLCNRLLEPFMYHKVLVTATEFENFFKLRCPQYYYEPENLYFRSKADWIRKWDSCFEDSIHYTWTDTDWLKINKSQAEIHIQAVAEAMWDAMNESTPKQLFDNEWHIPYGDNIIIPNLVSLIHNEELNKGNSDKERSEKRKFAIEKAKIKIATARAARVSYTVVGQEKEHSYEKDIELHDNLLASGHMSPFEHCAKAMGKNNIDDFMLIEGGETTLGVCRNFRGFIQYRCLVENEQ